MAIIKETIRELIKIKLSAGVENPRVEATAFAIFIIPNISVTTTTALMMVFKKKLFKPLSPIKLRSLTTRIRKTATNGSTIPFRA